MNGPTIEQVAAAVRGVLAGRPAGDAGGVFAGRLLGLREAQGLGEGVREVRVVAGTVVTPLARDYLRRAGVEVRVVAVGEVRTGGEWGFAVEVEDGLGAAVRRALLGEAGWREVGGTAREAAEWAAEEAGRGAVVMTREASVATWSACQVAGVRAATVADADAVGRACRHLGANVLVIEGRGQSIASVRFLCGVFRRAGLRGAGDADRGGDRAGDALPGASGAAAGPVGGRPALAVRGLDRRPFPAR